MKFAREMKLQIASKMTPTKWLCALNDGISGKNRFIWHQFVSTTLNYS
jgi:hypothetical protein